MPKSTESKSRRQAVVSAVESAVLDVAVCGGMLWLRQVYWPDGGLSVVLAVLAVIHLAKLIPLWLSLRERLQEIEGGEEDAAHQY